MKELEKYIEGGGFLKQMADSVSPQTPLAVIVTVKETQMQENLKSACAYLEELGIRHRSIGHHMPHIFAKMTPKQILGCVRQPYIQAISPDHPVYAI